MKIEALDHLVLTVADVPTSCAFYTRVLGMEEVTFGAGRKALVFGAQKINLHQHGREFEPKARQPTPGSADVCLLTSSSAADVIEHLRRQNIAFEEGPIQRTGARGPIESVYFRDPDGNLIEVSRYVV
jgi:catechol 2,3-dioxygenase-like lactoylglutathione lyase family enzyme